MKRNCLWILTGILVALALAGCAQDRDETSGYDETDNLVTEAAILGATGFGDTTVTKEGNRYKVTGKITAGTAYPSTPVNWVTLEIKADPNDLDKYFAAVTRFTFTCDFPDGAVKPYGNYAQGFNHYMECIKKTPTTDAWAGSWQAELQDEYNATGGVGKMTITRDLANYSNVRDYHQLVLRLKFAPADVGKDYSFYISDVGVYGNKIDNTYPDEVPAVHELSKLADATYSKDAAAAPLIVVPRNTPNSASYTFQWYKGTENNYAACQPFSTGESVTHEEAAANKIIPDTSATGTTYYYVKMTFEGRSTDSKLVKITVN